MGVGPWAEALCGDLTSIRLSPSRDWATGTLTFFIIAFQRDGYPRVRHSWVVEDTSQGDTGKVYNCKFYKENALRVIRRL